MDSIAKGKKMILFNKANIQKIAWNIIFFILVLSYIFYLGTKPTYNSDMLAYMGVVLEYSVKDPKSIHDSVYSITKREVPPGNYNDLIKRNPGRFERFTDYNKFYDYLTFFRLKPLYALIIFILYKSGIKLTVATYIPSLIGVFGLLSVCFHWVSKYVRRSFAFLIASMVLLLTSINELACLSAPDALSNFFILFSLYLITQKDRSYKLHVCLLLTILFRIDNAIFVFVYYLLDYNVFSNIKAPLLKLLLFISGVFFIIFFIPVLSGNNFNWFFQFKYLFSYSEYFRLLKKAIDQLRHPSYLIFFILLALLLYFNRYKKITVYAVVGITLILHLLLFPSVEERFFVAYKLFIIIGIIDLLHKLYLEANGNSGRLNI